MTLLLLFLIIGFTAFVVLFCTMWEPETDHIATRSFITLAICVLGFSSTLFYYIIIFFIVHLAFQGGAEWQKAYTLENYYLTPKSNASH